MPKEIEKILVEQKVEKDISNLLDDKLQDYLDVNNLKDFDRIIDFNEDED